MLCEKSYIDGKAGETNMHHYCDLTSSRCVQVKADKSACSVYEDWLRKRTGGKNA